MKQYIKLFEDYSKDIKSSKSLNEANGTIKDYPKGLKYPMMKDDFNDTVIDVYLTITNRKEQQDYFKKLTQLHNKKEGVKVHRWFRDNSKFPKTGESKLWRLRGKLKDIYWLFNHGDLDIGNEGSDFNIIGNPSEVNKPGAVVQKYIGKEKPKFIDAVQLKKSNFDVDEENMNWVS